MCKLLTFPRIYKQDPSSSFYSLASSSKPKFVFRFFDGVTSTPFCDPSGNIYSIGTTPKNVYSEKKTEYGIFSTGPLLVDNKQDFLVSFKLNLKENIVSSQTILGIEVSDNELNNFNVDAIPELDQEFQPLLTFGNSSQKDLMEIRCDNTVVNRRPLIFGTLGLVYKGTDLYLQFLSVDTTGDDYCTNNQRGKITSEIITASGVITIEFYRENEQLFFKVNGSILSTTTIGSPTINSVNTKSGSVFNIGLIHRSFYETRFLYCDLCSFYSEVENQLTFYTEFNNATEFSTNIIFFESTIDANKLYFYNYLLDYVTEDLLNLCCSSDTKFTISNAVLGCCFTPNEEDNRRYKLERWKFNSISDCSITNISMMNRIGDNISKEKLLKKITFLDSVLLYLQTIRDKINCEKKSYQDYISDETIELIINSFIPYGINIKCAFEIMDIGKFTNCCGDLGPTIDCNCTDELPSAVISAIPYQFNLSSEANQTITYTDELDYASGIIFNCCSGDKSIEVSSVLINPNNLPIEITPGPVTTNGTFSYDIIYNYLNAVVTDVKDFYVQFTICGKTILRKHLYSAIDTCVTIPTNNVPFENELAAITLDIDNGDFGVTRETFLTTINLGNFECCHSGQRSRIISIDSSRITSESGLTILSPEAGNESQGTIPFSYYFDGENAVAGTVQNVFITYSICDDLVYTGYVKFTIVNTCTSDLTPTFDPVSGTNLDLDLDTMGSGDYNIEIGVSAYQCCGQSNVLYLRFLPHTYQAYTVLALYGITFNFPNTIVQATNQINIPFKFNRDVYLAYKTNNTLVFPRMINFDFFYLACGPVPSLNNIINRYEIGFRLDDNCTPIFSGASSTTPIYHDLYLSRGNTIPVSTEVEFYCNSCDNNSGKFNYTGFRALENNSKLINTLFLPQLLASGVSIPFNAKPHQINLGPYTSAFPLPDFPVQKSTTIEMKTSCWDNVTPALPAVNTTYQLAINSFIADNYFRSDGGPGGLSVTNKTSTFSWNPNIDESLTIIALIAPDAVPLNLLLDQLGYTTLSAGAGSLEVEVYPLNSNTCNSFGSLIQNTGDVSILTNANITGTGMNNSLSYDLSALSGSGVLSSGATLPLGYGFYFIKFYLKDKTADSFSVRFNIT